jgi:6-phosphogluconolactonase
MTQNVRIYPDRQTLVEAATEIAIDRIRTAINERQQCSIALSGGSTPQPLYAALADVDLPWDRIHIFWGDERYVPATHPDSNYGMTKRILLDSLTQPRLGKVAIPPEHIHPMPTNASQPQSAADEYERLIRAEFGLEAGGIPAFDLVLLGMGDDAHTASLFPHTAALSVRDRLVTVGDKDGQPRLTFTFDLINQARSVIFLISGESKQPALAAVFAPTGDALAYPSRSVAPSGELLWLLDAAAGAKLP